MSELIDDLLLLSRVSRSELPAAPWTSARSRPAIVTDLRRGHPDRQVDVRIATG